MQNPIKRFFNSKKLPAKEKLSTVNSTFSSVINGLEHFGDSRGLKSYEESLYVFAGVYMVMQRVASIPLELYRIKNKQGDVAEIFDDPLLEVLSKPNELQSRREFFELSVAYYLLAGDCFWYLERVGSKIVSIVPLRPDYVQIVLSQDAKRIIAYEYSVNTIQRFRPEDVIHIKTTNPVNSLRGLGIMRTASTRIATEIEATNNQVNWFKNQGRPDIIVFAKGDPSQEERDRARAQWQEKFGGSKSGSVAFLGEQYERIETLNKTPQELGFIESKKSLRDDIFMVLRIPKPMYTSDDVNLANAKEGNRIFIANAVMPVLDAFIDVINHKLIAVGDVAKFFTYTDPTPMDREALLKETTELKKNGIITANEARALYNYEAMEGADELSTQSNMPDPAAEAQMKAVRKQARAILRSRPVLVKKLDAIDALAALTLLLCQQCFKDAERVSPVVRVNCAPVIKWLHRVTHDRRPQVGMKLHRAPASVQRVNVGMIQPVIVRVLAAVVAHLLQAVVEVGC